MILSEFRNFLIIHEETFEEVGLSSNVYILKSNNGYIIFDTSGHKELLKFLIDIGINKDKIICAFLTHGHFDHSNGAISLIKNNIKCYMSYEDLYLIDFSPVLDINDGEKILEKVNLEVLKTPGHTPGSTCFYSESEALLISGDTVFSDGCFGRTDLPGGNSVAIKNSLRILSSLNIEVLFPGHGNYVTKGGSKIINYALNNAEHLI
ncbi:MAG: MBL fold metallo-hydrolase [Candidatus Methanomethylicia archaeon]|nr:MBL fold metallo-hydrolase [Candidatus Methanomethylicia archaeon]